MFFSIFAKNLLMRNVIATFLLLAICMFSMAQVQYDVEPEIEAIQSDYVKVWERVGETKGYRVQIMAVTGTNSRNTAENERALFQARFPEVPAYISYTEPYFKIRVGDFMTRLDAYKMLVEVRDMYPGAYIIIDKIKYSD
jgi:hypothetical protein